MRPRVKLRTLVSVKMGKALIVTRNELAQVTPEIGRTEDKEPELGVGFSMRLTKPVDFN